MRYLFIVQGEGRGHLTQAIALSEMLRRNGHEVTEVLVGCSRNRIIPAFFQERIGAKVRTYESPNFAASGNNKNINLFKSLVTNLSVRKQRRYAKSIEKIHRRIQKNRPDAVINFYELLAGLCNVRFREKVPFVAVAHQFLIRHPDFPYGEGSEHGKFFLRLYTLLCSIGTTKTLALSLYPLKDVYRDRIAVVPPLLRREVLELRPERNGFVLGYMLNPGYADEVRAWHKKHPETPLHFFWDKKEAPEELKIDGTLTFHRIDDRKFLHYMERCSAYVTTAGFESVCEALYLGKPIMMVPAHLEQQINAADTHEAYGGIVTDSFDLTPLSTLTATDPEKIETFRRWVQSAEDTFIRHLTT